MNQGLSPKPLIWIAGCLDDLREFPAEVRSFMGYALFVAQCGLDHEQAKPLKGYRGAGVLEVVRHFDGDTYHAVYTLRFAGRVYALHAFQMKSKRGIATPRADLELIRARLRRAEESHAEWLESQKMR